MRLRLVLGLGFLFLLFSCGGSKKAMDKSSSTKPKSGQTELSEADETISDIEKLPNPAKEKTPTFKSDIEQYIYQYKAVAKEEMQNYGIPASITLAQGILESKAGKGELTQRSNNHFGIKCHQWDGEKVYHDDDRKQECFRKYKNPNYSFRDHSVFLKQRKRYRGLFKLEKDNYKAWARKLKAAGYATDPAYPHKLITLIERYDLHQYDHGEKASETARSNQANPSSDKTEKKLSSGPESAEASSPKPAAPAGSNTEQSSETQSTYTVRRGDTLYSIAKQFGTTVKTLKEENQLDDKRPIYQGEELKVGDF